MTETLPNLSVSADLILRSAEACALADRALTFANLTEYCHASPRAVKEALKAAVWLGLISPLNGGFTSPVNVRSEFPPAGNKQDWLFRRFLQKKNSFVQFATFLDHGNTPETAAEKVRVLYQIDVGAGTLVKLFSSWGQYAQILADTKDGLQLLPQYHASDMPVDYLDGLRAALESDMKARIFIAHKLSEEAFRSVSEPGADRAVRALHGVGTDPRNAVEDIGELLEDYLRTRAADLQLPTQSAQGIGGLLKLLLDNGKLAEEHGTIGAALNVLRVMAAHPTRARSGLRWTLKQDSGLETVLIALTLIRSVHAFELRGETVF